MDARKLSAFCSISELTFVETGQLDQQSGNWFVNRKLDRIFYTDEEIYSKLDNRKRTFFETRRLDKVESPEALAH